MSKKKLTIEICGNVAFIPELELTAKSPHGGTIGALAQLAESLEEVCDYLKACNTYGWDDEQHINDPVLNDEQERAANRLKDLIDAD